MPGPTPNDSGDDNASDAGLVAKGQAGDNAAPLTITEISNLLKRTVEDRFGWVKLRGELSGVKRAASGHFYCCLKDEGAVIDGVMWRGNAAALGFLPEDGIEVVASGNTFTGEDRRVSRVLGHAQCHRPAVFLPDRPRSFDSGNVLGLSGPWIKNDPRPLWPGWSGFDHSSASASAAARVPND